MGVSTVVPDKWYEYEGSGMVVCGSCVLADLRKTRLGELTGDEVITLDMVNELTDEELDGGVQCDGCLEQSEGYGEDE